MSKRELSPRQQWAVERRKAQKAREKREAEERAAKVDIVKRRLLRRCPALAGSWSIDIDAGIVYSMSRKGGDDHHDGLATRTPPKPYKGWREDFRRHVACLGIDYYPAGHGLPLAHEGGAPPRPRDEPTFELARVNSTATFTAEMLYIVAMRDVRAAVERYAVRLDGGMARAA
jgi:hypothetical protein